LSSAVPFLIGVDAPVYLALITILFVYALRYYIFSPIALRVPRRKRNSMESYPKDRSLISSLSNEGKQQFPFVSILLPLYNERNVVNRLLTACSSLNYPNYEVIVIDDSTDDTTKKLEEWSKKGTTASENLKIIHRESRTGWKAGALNEGLENLNEKSEYVLVFDADFVPKKDTIERFLCHFMKDREIEIVQGYQKHDLNADENWMTRALRIFHSTAYKIDLEARAELNMMVPIMGSVFMLKSSLAKEFRFEHAITEDYNLTVRLYLHGHRVLYDSSLEVSGECPSALLRVFKQIGRWAEGTTRDTRKYFFQVMKSSKMSRRVKLDYMVSGLSYLSSLALLAATIIGLANTFYLEAAVAYPITFAAIILSTLALPASAVAQSLSLYQDNAVKRIKTIPCSLFLSYILIPVTSYYSLRGLFFEAKSFERTFKTGKVMIEKPVSVPGPLISPSITKR
jgi:cellulose synthase/poly-beta-1,6-N-acetylglucosamine synthase-like glycosyltransferase